MVSKIKKNLAKSAYKLSSKAKKTNQAEFQQQFQQIQDGYQAIYKTLKKKRPEAIRDSVKARFERDLRSADYAAFEEYLRHAGTKRVFYGTTTTDDDRKVLVDEYNRLYDAANSDVKEKERWQNPAGPERRGLVSKEHPAVGMRGS